MNCNTIAAFVYILALFPLLLSGKDHLAITALGIVVCLLGQHTKEKKE